MITIDKYTSLELVDKGKYGFQLMEGWVGKDGDFKPSFCKREMGKAGEKVEKTLPLNVKLGDRDTAISVARYILTELGEGEAEPF
jgi:hypothetical protein